MIQSFPLIDELHLWFCRREDTRGSDQFLREVLARYGSVSREQLRFSAGPHGKPALSGGRLPVAFNLSHGGDWTVLAVSAGAAVGVDLEYCDPGREVEKLARRFCSDAEALEVISCTGQERINRFYEYWTLKEAAIKARGESLGQALDSTSFELGYPGRHPGQSPIGAIVPAAGSSAARGAWYGLWQPFASYRLAICCLAPQDFTAGVSQFIRAEDTQALSSPELLAISPRPYPHPEPHIELPIEVAC